MFLLPPTSTREVHRGKDDRWRIVHLDPSLVDKVATGMVPLSRIDHHRAAMRPRGYLPTYLAISLFPGLTLVGRFQIPIWVGVALGRLVIVVGNNDTDAA